MAARASGCAVGWVLWLASVCGEPKDGASASGRAAAAGSAAFGAGARAGAQAAGAECWAARALLARIGIASDLAGGGAEIGASVALTTREMLRPVSGPGARTGSGAGSGLPTCADTAIAQEKPTLCLNLMKHTMLRPNNPLHEQGFDAL